MRGCCGVGTRSLLVVRQRCAVDWPGRQQRAARRQHAGGGAAARRATAAACPLPCAYGRFCVAACCSGRSLSRAAAGPAFVAFRCAAMMMTTNKEEGPMQHAPAGRRPRAVAAARCWPLWGAPRCCCWWRMQQQLVAARRVAGRPGEKQAPVVATKGRRVVVAGRHSASSRRATSSTAAERR